MTFNMSQLLKPLTRGIAVKAVAAVATLGVLPTAAFADHGRDYRERERYERHDRYEYRGGWDHRDRGGFFFGIDLRPDPVVVVPPPPVYEDREVQVWVEPVYRTCVDHVWVPERVEFREVVRYHGRHREVCRERVMIEPGHYEDVQRQELVTPGHYETRVERVSR